jgi:holin (3TMs family)
MALELFSFLGAKAGEVLLEKAGKLASVFVQDATKKLELTAEIQRLTTQAAEAASQRKHDELMAEIDLLKAQIEANKIQASSTNIFVAGARPAAMWVCVLGLIYNFLGYPFIRWGNAVFQWTSVPPELDNTTLTWLVAGLFGLTAARTYEKRKRVATSDFRSHPDDAHAPRALPVNTPPK